jgi:hypothetical protein
MAIAFYPCCGVDIEQPLMLLENYVDEVVFCDMEKRLSSHWRQVAADAVNNLPSATFRVGDLTQIANELPIIICSFTGATAPAKEGVAFLCSATQFFLSSCSVFRRKGV